MTLADMKEGEVATVLNITGYGAIKQRLLDMGITKDTIIEVKKYAPLKDPVQISVKGYSLALRVTESRLIHVRKTNS